MWEGHCMQAISWDLLCWPWPLDHRKQMTDWDQFAGQWLKVVERKKPQHRYPCLMSPGEHGGTLIITWKGLFLHAHGGEVTAWCSHIGSSPQAMEVIKIMICKSPTAHARDVPGILIDLRTELVRLASLCFVRMAWSSIRAMKQMFCLLCVLLWENSCTQNLVVHEKTLSVICLILSDLPHIGLEDTC